MKDDFNKYNYKKLLSNKKQYIIPRYQRPYSWKKKNVVMFVNDIFKQIKVGKKSIKTNDYFVGIMIVQGNINSKNNRKIEIVDGQQRLTTAIMALSIISKRLLEIGEKIEAHNTFKYIIAKNKRGNEFKTLISNTSQPYFYHLVQEMNGDYKLDNFSSEEDKDIRIAYGHLERLLSYKSLSKRFNAKENELLVAIREQILKCYFF